MERPEGERVSVYRRIFGPKPKDAEVYAFVLAGWDGCA